MGRVQFGDIFRNDYLTVITSYCNRIQGILENYDVAIFMARKAICLYSAMKENGELRDATCHVISSRVIDYDSLERFRNQRIAVVDDVVVKGESINQVATKLLEAGVIADYYVAVCEVTFAERFEKMGVQLHQSYTHYTQQEVYQMAGLITQYIEASMCSFNIDSPIYEVNVNETELQRMLYENGAATLTSNIQKKFGIESKVLYFNLELQEGYEKIGLLIQTGILKIRFYFNGEKIIAVPFVLLQACDKGTLEYLYEFFKCDVVDELVNCNNTRLHDENKLKIISYLLSTTLMNAFIYKFDVSASKVKEIDLFQFDLDTDSIFKHECARELKRVFEKLFIQKIRFSSFKFSEYVKEFYHYIAIIDPVRQKYENAIGEKIGVENKVKTRLERLVFSFEDLENNIFVEDMRETKRVYVSSLIDVFIDKGMIVPSVVHYDDNKFILRAYKMGEYSKLTRDQINAFAKMLYSYQILVDRELDRTEFEKLCVLFFQAEVTSGIFKENSKFEEGMYSIAYSLYGPRVSLGKLRYAVDSDSAIITDFSENGLIRNHKRKYYVTRDISIEDADMEKECKIFAMDFAKLAHVFKTHPYHVKKNPWNTYVHTYNQFLVLLAIGKSPKNQILSLCAELNQILRLDKDMFFKDASVLPVKSYQRALSGIDSGLWKYRCFKNQAYERTEEQILEYGDYDAWRGIVRVRREFDKNGKLIEILDLCGELLYQSAFFINEALKATERLREYAFKNSSERIKVEETECNTIFSIADYYGLFAEERHSIETYIYENKKEKDFEKILLKCLFVLQRKAKLLLDWCDLYLEKDVPNYSIVRKFLIIYSEKGGLPTRVGGLTPIELKNVSKRGEIEIFSIQDGEEVDLYIDSAVKETQDMEKTEYLYFEMVESWEGFIQIENSAKSTYLEELICKILEEVKCEPITAKKRLTIITPKEMKIYKEFGKTKVNKYRDDIVSRYHLIKYTLWRKREMTEKVVNNYNGPISKSIIGNVDTIGTFNNEYQETNTEQLMLLLEEIRMAGKELPEVEKQEMDDYIETIQDVIVQDKPKRGLIKTAYNGLMALCTNPKFIDAVSKLAPVVQKMIESQ